MLLQKKFIILTSCDIILTKLLGDVFKIKKASEDAMIVLPGFIAFSSEK